MNRILIVILVASGVLCGFTQKPEIIRFEKAPWFFDAGGAKSTVADGKILVSPGDIYSEEKGYGWLSPGLGGFLHKEVKDARDVFLTDGVSGAEVEFKADIPGGEWWLTVWFEAGTEDSSTTRMYVQGENTTPKLQAFTPPSEKRATIQRIYRVVQQKILVGENGAIFKLEGIEDEVRLLGFAFIPVVESSGSSLPRSIMEKIQKAGEFDSQMELEPVIAELEKLSDNPEYQNIASYWKLQLELLNKAEKYFYYRGWSWATEKTGLGLFDHLHQSVMLFDGVLNRDNPESNPLYERALWYRGRLLYWLWLERGIHFEKDAAERDLARMLELHPENELVQMYNGEKIESPYKFDADKPEEAPEWAFAQWELMNRLKNIAEWWTLEQQDENGEFGGKFGDDVEILRFWSPLILSGDPVVYQGWKKLADGVWNSSKVYKGYAKNPSDVEHSSEFIADTAPLMVLYNDEAKYENRLAYSAEYFRELWTGFNDNGQRFFKSAWFSSTEIETEPPKNRDVAYNARAAKAVRYYAWKTGDSKTIQALEEWAEAWIEATRSTQKGKPAGIIPASVEFPTGAVNGDEPDWVTANMFWDYFDWSGGAAILDQFLYTWSITGNGKYLEPILTHLDLVKKYEAVLDENEGAFKKGTEKWAAVKLGSNEAFWSVVETWRLLSGNRNYDDLIRKYGTPFIKYRLTGNTHHLVEGMQPYLETVRYNLPMFTTEAIHTDRVHIAPNREREAGILQAMVTGYGIAESSSPYIAVSWEETSRDLAMLVTGSDSTRLHMDIYSFSDTPQKATMRLWQLKEGTYRLQLHSGNQNPEIREINISSRGERVQVVFPAQKLTKLSITPTND